MKLKDIKDIDVHIPLSIFIDKKEVFCGMVSELKHTFSRQEWMDLCEYYVTKDEGFIPLFGVRVIRLKKLDKKGDI